MDLSPYPQHRHILHFIIKLKYNGDNVNCKETELHKINVKKLQ